MKEWQVCFRHSVYIILRHDNSDVTSMSPHLSSSSHASSHPSASLDSSVSLSCWSRVTSPGAGADTCRPAAELTTGRSNSFTRVGDPNTRPDNWWSSRDHGLCSWDEKSWSSKHWTLMVDCKNATVECHSNECHFERLILPFNILTGLTFTSEWLCILAMIFTLSVLNPLKPTVAIWVQL